MNIDEAIKKLKQAEGNARIAGTTALKTEVNEAIKLNFSEQGRPERWKGKKRYDGRAILTGRTGNGQRTINIQEDLYAGNVKVGSPLIYMKAHQEGATIFHPARAYSFRKKRNGKFVYARKDYSKPAKQVMGKAYTVKLDARPWAVWLNEDTERAAPNISRAVELSFK